MANTKSTRKDEEQFFDEEVLGNDIPAYVDQVTVNNVTALGLGPAVATVNAYLGASMAQQQLYFDAVSQQNHTAMASLGITVKSVEKMLDIET